jgi:hypothetical protein
MNPKEKAIELVEEMASSIDVFKINFNSKRCALVAVDKIIEVAYWNSVKDFYREVKQEIEKL